MSLKKIGIVLISLLIVILLATFFFKGYLQEDELVEETVTEVSHQVIIEKIESLGKLELVKFLVKDIVEHKETKEWWPDPKVVLIASGEVVGCIDLEKIDSASIWIEADKITIKLPEPEICYHKVDHQQSKVYSLEYGLFQETELVDKAYKVAEKEILKAGLKMKILDQTKQNAVLILKPFLAGLTYKKVEIIF